MKSLFINNTFSKILKNYQYIRKQQNSLPVVKIKQLKTEFQLSMLFYIYQYIKNMINRNYCYSTYDNDASNINNLQKALLKVWSRKNVDEDYQNIVLNYLDTVSQSSMQKQLSNQIKLAHQEQSYYFYLDEKLHERKMILKQINQLLFNFHRSNEQFKPDMRLIAQNIANLRQINLDISENTLKFFEYYGKNNEQRLVQYCVNIFQQLDNDNIPIKESFLSDYILFQQGYDPFLVYQLNLKNKHKSHAIKSHPEIDKLTNLNISYSCRLIKARNGILELLSSGKIRRQSQKIYREQSNTQQNRNKKQKQSNWSLPYTVIIPKDEHKNERDSYKRQLKQKQQDDESKKTSINFRNRLSLSTAKQNNRQFSIYSPIRKIQKKTKNQNGIQSFKKSRSMPKQEENQGNHINQSQYYYDYSKNKFYKLIPIQQSRKIKKNKKSTTEDSDDRHEQLLHHSRFEQGRKLIPIPKHVVEDDEDSNDQMDQNLPITQKSKLTQNDRNLQDNKKEIQRENENRSKIYKYKNIFNSPDKNNQVKRQKEQKPQTKPIQNIKNDYKKPKIQLESRPLSKNQEDESEQTPQKNQRTKNKKQIVSPDKKHEQRTKKPESPHQKGEKVISNAKQKPQIKKQIKMKASKIDFKQLSSYFKTNSLDIKTFDSTINNEKWMSVISKCQSYGSQFYINDSLATLALTVLMPDGNYVIKYWGKTKKCDNETSVFLFKKYLDYLEKCVKNTDILFNGDECEEILQNEFIKQKQRIYIRKRKTPILEKQSQIPNFLSLKCSNIQFNQKSESAKMLYSQQIESFTEQNSYVINQIATVNKSTILKNISILIKISENIQNMATFNKILEDQGFDTYEIAADMKINNINAIRLEIESTFKSPFIAADGYVKFFGEQIFRKQKALLSRISCSKHNTKILFGKGFNNMSLFVKSYSKQSKKTCEFSVKMFNKQLYGRIAGAQFQKFGCYGNWQISLFWQDQLQGRLKHPMTSCDCFGPQSFFVGVQIEGELIYCFEVKQQDFCI